jgi:hypothetical protein
VGETTHEQSASHSSRCTCALAALFAVLAMHAVVRPRLARDLLATAWAFRRRDWFARLPFLPVPDPEYLRWRMFTAYGDEAAVPPAEDVIRFARWRRNLLRL